MRCFRLLLVLFPVWLALPDACLAAGKSVIRVCHEDNDSYPWILKGREGVTLYQLKLVEQRLGTTMEMHSLPWKRCMAEIKNGSMDAAFKISFSPLRAQEIGDFPLQANKPNVAKRLLTDTYSLYRLKGSSLSWDGKALKANGAIGAQTGFSIVEQLQKLGVQVDEGGREPESHFRKLLLGRLAGVALQTQEGDQILSNSPELQGKIEKVEPVLVEKPYFFIFSKPFHKQHPEQVEQVWNAIEAVRESNDYKKYFQNFK